MTMAVPFGMESADFRQLVATVAIAACAALVVVVLAIVVRDVLVARYAALGRQEQPGRPSRGTHLSPIPGAPISRLYEHEIPVVPHDVSTPWSDSDYGRKPNRGADRRPPRADPGVWPEPTMTKDARLRTPSPASDLPAPPKGTGGIAPPKQVVEHRISAQADRDADRTRLDLTPTEEK